MRCFLVAALLLTLPACYTWRPTSVDPRTLINDEHPQSVRVTMNGGERITLEDPEMVNDSIVGFTDSGVVKADAADLGLLEVPRFSIFRTVAFVGTHVAVIVGFVAFVIWVQPHYRGF